MSQMNFTYSIFIGARGEAFCRVFRKPDMPGPLRLRRGKSMENYFPEGVAVQMVREYPGTQVADSVYNLVGCPIVSERMKLLLEAESDSKIEYHAITLIDHKGQPAPSKAFFANVLRVVPGLNVKRSKGLKDPTRPGCYMELNQITLDPAKLTSAPDFFRLEERTEVVIVRSDLRTKMEQAGLTVDFLELGERVRI